MEKNLDSNFEELPTSDLAALLRQFYGSVRNKNGQLYTKNALLNLRSAINRHLTSPPFNLKINIGHDKEFQTANQVFSGILKKMRVDGKDKTQHKDAITEGDMAKMYDTEILSDNDPFSLQRKVFVELGIHFARRGREGLRELRKDSFEFRKDENGKEYATIGYHEMSKNHNGLDRTDTEKTQIIYEQEQLCPIKSLKLYISKLNPQNDAFYQKPKARKYHNSATWYENKALGKNTLGQMMKTISEAANLSKIYTNHCLRVTTATVLAKAGVETRNICSVTGHRNEASLKSYIQGPTMQQRHAFSTTLGSHGKKSISRCETSTPTSLANPAVHQDASSSTSDSVTDLHVTAPVLQMPSSPSSSQLDIPVVSSPQLTPVSPKPSHLSQISTNVNPTISSLFNGAVFNGPTSIHLHYAHQ